MTEATQPWAGLHYMPVRGLVDRRISRYLRTQRKNMRRFFAERGLFDELEQMERIRKSRQGMVAKNEMFKEVLDSYAKLVNQSSEQKLGEAPQPIPEAAPVEDAVGVLAMPDEGRQGPDGSRPDDGASVSRVADEGSGSEPVIEE
ncbi:MAG TPA: hypothetical protein VNZ53_26630 [Steroidobacteraceae bacterium]|jgi:hypothetical protein|nr:hypothetical protein [Steroidobacteraceae bacterium]